MYCLYIIHLYRYILYYKSISVLDSNIYECSRFAMCKKNASASSQVSPHI